MLNYLSRKEVKAFTRLKGLEPMGLACMGRLSVAMEFGAEARCGSQPPHTHTRSYLQLSDSATADRKSVV